MKRNDWVLVFQMFLFLLPIHAGADAIEKTTNKWIYIARHSAFDPSGNGNVSPSIKSWYLDSSGFLQTVEIDHDVYVLSLKEKQKVKSVYEIINNSLLNTGIRVMPADKGVIYSGLEAVSIPERILIYAGTGKTIRVIYSGPATELPSAFKPMFRLLDDQSSTATKKQSTEWIKVQPDLEPIRRRSIPLTQEKLALAQDLDSALNTPMRMVEMKPGQASTVLGSSDSPFNWVATVENQGAPLYCAQTSRG